MSEISVSTLAMEAHRIQMEVIANNLANARTTRTADGTAQPFRRQQVLFQTILNKALGPVGGMQIQQIADDKSDFPMEFNPHHPDADAQGYVRMPNVSPETEMVDMMAASRAYEANQFADQIFDAVDKMDLRILA